MLMRSKLFIPGSRPELFAKAAASAADALSFDLEDAVAQDRKDSARETLSAHLREGQAIAKTVVVRVNAVGSPWFEADMDAIACANVGVVNLPSVEDVSAIYKAAAMLDRLEPQCGLDVGHIKLLVNIETPKGLRKAAELGSAHARIIGLQTGYADLLEPCGIARNDQHALAYVRLTVRFAAAEAGVAAYDGAFGAVNDPDGFLTECDMTRRHGFAGKTCIHPTQIAIANAAFMPTEAEVAHARRVLAAAAQAEAKGVGAYMVDGHMIDAPFLIRARAIVAMANLHETQTEKGAACD